MFYYLILFLLACFGLTHILVNGKIFEFLRKRVSFFKCSMCVGFWVGAVISLIFAYSGFLLFQNVFVNPIIMGFISSGVSYLFCNLVDDKGIRTRERFVVIKTGGEK